MLLFIAVGGVIDNSTFHDINGLRLTWDPPMFPQGTIMHYEVRANGSNVLRTFRTGSTEFIASNHGLSPGVYCIQVCCVCASICVCACVYMCMHVNIRVRVCVRVCVYVHVCIGVCYYHSSAHYR